MPCVGRGRNKNINKKIIGIFVIILLIATALPVTGTLQQSEEKNIKQTDVGYEVFFGYMRATAKIDKVYSESQPGYTDVYSYNVSSVFFIGFGKAYENNRQKLGLFIRHIQNPYELQVVIKKIVVPTQDYVTLSGFFVYLDINNFWLLQRNFKIT